MADTNRKIHELVVDYAGALRDGSIPVFLKSLTREEGHRIASSADFWDATEMVRVLNSVGFADKAVAPNVSLFTSRVDAEIATRLKRIRVPPRGKRSTNYRHVNRTEKTEKPI